MREHLQFYIDGQWVAPAEPRMLDVINPATEEVAGRISIGSAADVDRAVAAARKAFRSWSRSLGVSFSHAFAAILPSCGSSDVIVLRAEDSEQACTCQASLKAYQGLRCLEALHLVTRRTRRACPPP